MIAILASEPVILLHGLNSNNTNLEYMKEILEEETGREVINCNIGAEGTVLYTVEKQAEILQTCVEQYPSTKQGFIGIGHSNGAYVLRHFLQMINDPPMKTFISLAGPLNGYYCDRTISDFCMFETIIPDITDEEVKQIVYTSEYQTMGPANYFRDLSEEDNYVNNALSLPIINNEKLVNADIKSRFLSLNQLIAFGSDNDGVIIPNWSTHFGDFVYDEDATPKYNVIPFTETRMYKEDLYGLETLHKEGKLLLFSSGLTHSAYIKDEAFIRNILAEFVGEADEPAPINQFKVAVIGVSVVAVLLLVGLIIAIVIRVKKVGKFAKEEYGVVTIE